MNRRRFVKDSLIGIAGLSGLASSLRARSGRATPSAEEAGANLRLHWPVASTHLFHGALEDGIGFSFSFDGQRVGPAVPQGWEISTETGAGVSLTRFQHPAGLIVLRETRSNPEFESLEYTLRFKNEGSSILPVLGPIIALDLGFGEKALEGVSVVSSGGGMAESIYPPATFAIQRHYLGPMTPVNGQVSLTTVGGRSSNRNLPFYFVENQEESAGIFVAFGWSGQWRSAVSRGGSQFLPPNYLLRVTGEVPDIHLQLQPGEEITGPRILIGCYRGPLSAGSNRLRRLIREHYTPLLEGKKPQPILVYDHWWNIGVQFDEALLRRLVDAAAELGQEAFLLDAGWYVGSRPPSDFSAGVGNWEEVDPAKFPSGLRAFTDYVRSKNLKFGIWFEPERVAKGSLLAEKHPEWVIWLPKSALEYPPDIWGERFTDPSFGLLDYGPPDVQEWVRSLIDGFIREYDIRYIRYDFNMDPLAYWATHDPANRHGISQIRHIEGLYRVIDWLRVRHPQTEMEGCSSGGRRIDLETVRRFHSFWISDQTVDPHIIRFHLHGANYFLPGNYLYTCYTLPLPGQKDFVPTDISFQSFFGGEFGTGGRVDQWPPNMRGQARRHIEIYTKIKGFLVEDYYPLTPQARDLESWEAWQFHNPQTNEGFVQAFRLDSPQSSKAIAVKGLDPKTIYRLSDPYSGNTWQLAGSKLIEDGFEFRLAQLSSQVLLYRGLS